jgi:glycosyltransferase involved in cell wall biosynthesis
MIKLIDLTYYANPKYNHPIELIEDQKESLGFVSFIKHRLNIQMVKHLKYETSVLVDGITFTFFKMPKRFWWIPFKTHAYIKQELPDVVLVQGLKFPLQILFLKFSLGRRSKIIVQHHGERPFKGIKSLIQKIADRYIDAYIFTSIGNAKPWLDKRIISSPNKLFEVLEASTFFKKGNKQEARKQLSMCGELNFLWVGRLDRNKDPLTVIAAFEKYLQFNTAATLFMVYQNEDLIDEIKNVIKKNETLQKGIKLIGKIPHQELCNWYTAADYYISASHKEGSGYALLEAMSCGCVPIVTDIPSFRTMTPREYAFLYEPGNAHQLFTSLMSLDKINYDEYSEGIQSFFTKDLSFKVIAEKLAEVCLTVTSS